MIKYIVDSIKGESVIREVGIEYVSLLEEPWLAWELNHGEWKAKFTAPKELATRSNSKEKLRWYWFSFYDSEKEANAAYPNSNIRIIRL